MNKGVDTGSEYHTNFQLALVPYNFDNLYMVADTMHGLTTNLPLVDLQVVALSVVPDTESKISFSVFPYKMFTISSLLLQLSKEREVKCNGSLHINVGQPTLPMGSRQSLFQAEDLKQQMCIFSNF